MPGRSEPRISLEQALVELRRVDLDLLLAGLLLQLLHRRASFLISPWAMSRASRISASVTPLGAGLDHQDRLVGAGDDQVEVELLVASPRAG